MARGSQSQLLSGAGLSSWHVTGPPVGPWASSRRLAGTHFASDGHCWCLPDAMQTGSWPCVAARPSQLLARVAFTAGH